MSRSQRARWWYLAALVGAAVVTGAFLLLIGQERGAAVLLALCLVTAWFMAPIRRSEEVRHWEAQDRLVRDGRIIVYWRPGCLACARMRWRLGGLTHRATWVDIWTDPEAAAFVRDVNGGAETVPTVIFSDGRAVTNPDPGLLRAELAGCSKAA
ncbi:glutaredoxin domain-containing protein [Gephyromycinifex aptenodytis]|uniref:glutaredoxin domain-containing protein n=1 Tax=Gephyromycinifex aptenodytis TaxID=2716227 RepID=UPI001D028714|nr:glutaredoxin domain-containing protein [Gephyromycinifex aptenodytis]